MNDKITRSFAEDRHNPFQFKQLKLCDSLEEVNKLTSPKLVFASPPDMQCGFSRELFIEWCKNENNLIILTKRPAVNTLAREAYKKYEKSLLVEVSTLILQLQ